MKHRYSLLLDILVTAVSSEFHESKFIEYVKNRFDKNPEEFVKATVLASDVDNYDLELAFEEFVKKLVSDARKEGVDIVW